MAKFSLVAQKFQTKGGEKVRVIERGTKKQIREFAKELFLTPDDVGNHKFSISEIALKIKEVFGKGVSGRTIYNWVTKYKWNEEWNQIVTELTATALRAYKENETKDEKEREQIREILRNLWIENFKMMQELKKVAYQSLQKELSPATAIALLRLILEYELEIEPKINVEHQGEVIIRWGDGTPAGESE
jgi:hypothetical protein